MAYLFDCSGKRFDLCGIIVYSASATYVSNMQTKQVGRRYGSLAADNRHLESNTIDIVI